jgi:parallel beta-helix repeat protein
MINKRITLMILTISLIGSIAFLYFNLYAEIKTSFQKTNATKSIKEAATINGDKRIYKLNLDKWGIFNNGTHPIETTEGINKALKWAKKRGYSTLYIPGGTYLISGGKSDSDPKARINMISDMSLLLDKETTLQKETNGNEIYSVIYLEANVKNVTISGGTLRGDRETHDFSQKGKTTDGTHEWGNGITTAGASNVLIDGVKIKNFIGDGIEIGGSVIYGDYISEKDLELGGINNLGIPISQKGKVRSNNYKVANFNESIYQNPHFRNLMMWLPKGIGGTYDLFYYNKDGNFIKSEKKQRFNSTWGFSRIPEKADFFRVVFNAFSTKNIQVNRMTVAITENMTIRNCDIGYNRRQGITVGASDNIKIINNKIHNTKGTAPESGIDIEPGYYPAINTLVKGNEFLNNKIHMVFSYGGKAKVEENYFGPNLTDGIGFSINPAYYGAIIANNKFERTNFVTWGNTRFLDNTLISSSASFEGGNDVIVNTLEGIDSNLIFNQTEKKGIKVSNISLKSSNKRKGKGGIAVYGMPIYMNNITLKGKLHFSGDGNSGNVYDRITFDKTSEINLAPGTYNECSTNEAQMALSTTGKIKLNKCIFKNTIFYTYNQRTSATIQKSTLNNDKSITGPVLVALEAKNIKVINNMFKIKSSKMEEKAIIQIGRDASEHDSTKVHGATIKGNKITSNIKRIGIDTINGGIGAPSYLIQDNFLENTSINLNRKDINLKNKIIKK